LITISFSDGFGVGPGPTLRGFFLAAVIHAASFFSVDAIFANRSEYKIENVKNLRAVMLMKEKFWRLNESSFYSNSFPIQLLHFLIADSSAYFPNGIPVMY
jgi:hypothetical protein